MTPTLQVEDELLAGCAYAAQRASHALLSSQHHEGYWWADLTADTTLESDWILTQLFLHAPVDGVWTPPNRDLVDKAVESIIARQLPDGGFNIYPQGPSEISATVKAYFALKAAGVDVNGDVLARARERILALGGIQSANSYTKVNLSFFGLYPRQACPSIPPEIILLGKFIYQMSSWTRAIVIPLSIVHALHPQRPLPAGFTLDELWLRDGKDVLFERDRAPFSWRNLFLVLDQCAKFWDRFGSQKIRQIAIRKAEKWMIERTRYTDGLGAIYPPMMYAIMALELLGYAPDHPDRVEAERQFSNLLVNDRRGFYFQPCFSVVWDTAIAAYALGAGAVPREALRRSADWLLTKEVRRKGDWSVKRPNTEPSGWYFEFANEFYPDIDDTAMVLLALSRSRDSRDDEQRACERRAVAWLLDMQSKDGGWAAFDVDNNWGALSYVPFADHNAMLDPTCPDITGRVIEALCACGVDRNHPAIRRGVAYLLRTQEADGSWYGRWGVDYIYGTFLALRGLAAAGVSDREAEVQRALEWIRSCQNFDGGWGESCASYDHNRFTPAASTPSQTAWAVLGLLAGGDTTSTSLHDGIEYLVRTQSGEGTWEEDLATGTGFPRVFYLCYHLYRNSFPLLALNSYLSAKAPSQGQ